eukprot:5819734-Pleurochrysis_carterae.AAC.3
MSRCNDTGEQEVHVGGISGRVAGAPSVVVLGATGLQRMSGVLAPPRYQGQARVARSACGGRAEIRVPRGRPGARGCIRRPSLARPSAARLCGERARWHRAALVHGWGRYWGDPARVHGRLPEGVHRPMRPASRRSARRRRSNTAVTRRWPSSVRPHTFRAGICKRNRAGGCGPPLLRAERPSRCSRSRSPCETGRPRCRLFVQQVQRTVRGHVATSGRASPDLGFLAEGHRWMAWASQAGDPEVGWRPRRRVARASVQAVRS